MEYTSIKCLHPKRITNRWTGKEVLVECGKCEACLTKKNVARKTRCQLESMSHKYHYFVTLTYRRKFRPLIRIVHKTDLTYDVYRFRQNESFYNKTTHQYDYHAVFTDEYLGEVTFPNVLAKSQLSKKVRISGNLFPSLSKRDGQLFIKRLRKYYPNEKIRYFMVGEYGPVHFAPHIHLSLWFETEQTAKTIHEAIRACWPFGRIDSQVSNGKSTSYVSGYLNSNNYLPRIYKIQGTSPFQSHSFYLGESVFQDENKKLSQTDYLGFAERRICRNGFNTKVSLWRSLTSRYFPKCKGYVRKSEYERVFAARTYAAIRDWTQETCPLYQARFITDYVIYHDFYHEVPALNDLLQYFRVNCGYYQRDFNTQEMRYLTPHIDDWDKFERSVYMQLRFSKFFLSVICNGDDTFENVRDRVRFVDEFYKTIEYDNLKKQIKVKCQISKTSRHADEDISFLYHNTLIVDDLINSDSFLRYSQLSKERFENYVKHKELNDRNKIFNY